MRYCNKCEVLLIIGNNWLESCKRNSDYTCTTCRNSKAREWRKSNPDKVKYIFKKYSLKKRYGITLDEYLDKVLEQENRCAICDLKGEDFSRDLAVDHNHITGKVRGLLCTNCNTAIGKLNDDSILIQKALDYLEKYDES